MCKIVIVILSVFYASVYGVSEFNFLSDTSFSKEQYILGTGVSQKSFDEAQQRAMVDISKQLSVSIKDILYDNQTSYIKNGKETYSNTVISQTSSETNKKIEGIIFYGKALVSGNYCIRAALDKKRYGAFILIKFNEHKKVLISLISEINISEEKAGLKNLNLAESEVQEMTKLRTDLSAVMEITDEEIIPYSLADLNLIKGRILEEKERKNKQAVEQSEEKFKSIPWGKGFLWTAGIAVGIVGVVKLIQLIPKDDNKDPQTSIIW